MSTTVTYKGETLTTVENQTRTLQTAGKYLEGDIILTDETGGGGGGGDVYIFTVAPYANTEVWIGGIGGTYITPQVAFASPSIIPGTTVTFGTFGDYILDTVTGLTSGNTIPFVTVSRGTYTFTMPNESVYCSLYYDD